jgi:hypothetical protein
MRMFTCAIVAPEISRVNPAINYMYFYQLNAAQYSRVGLRESTLGNQSLDIFTTGNKIGINQHHATTFIYKK